jgi:predicted thioesterase
MEAATVEAAAPLLDEGRTTVGVAVRVEHLRPTPVGGTVDVTAELSDAASAGRQARPGRRLTFAVRAVDASGTVVAAGEIDRAIVDRARFTEAARGTPGT